MAKVKLPLEMANGVMVRTIEELRENFDIKKVVGYFLDGKLNNWLEARYYEEEFEKVNDLSESDPELVKKLCEIFGVEYIDEKINVDVIQEKNERLLKLKQYTDDEEIIANIDSVAFNQEELAELYDKKIKTIYLCGENFNISLLQKNIHYIGVTNATVEVPSQEEINFDEIGLQFDKLEFDEKYQSIMLSNFEKAKVLHSNKQYADAKILFEKHAQRGNLDAMWYLGLYYGKGYGGETNLKKSFEWYFKAAEKGDFDSMNAVAICYEEGKGIEKNLQKAAEWFKKGADGGHMYAMYNYARCCQQGIGVYGKERERENYIYWYKKSAELGHAYAMGVLADEFRVWGPDSQMIYWAEMGEEKDNERSIEILVTQYNRMGEYEKVFTLMEKHAQKGDVRAVITLYDWYSSDRVVLKPYRDYNKSLYWLKKAAEAGDINSIAELSFRYAQGCKGVKENKSEAQYWAKKHDSATNMWRSYYI